MNAKREKAEALFDEALKLKPEERAKFSARACGNDLELRKRLEELLQAEAEAGAFLPEQPNETIAAIVAVTEKPGDCIGRYKLLEKIGEGGMGVVYMAEQREPVVRKVALKIIKLGMDTRQVVARFEAERQALAMMDHPNIAKILDAGATESGRPYFAMELVQGVPITRFCDENRLATEARLKLFIPVCQAIQSAHQKGVIHRDLKPSNVLVTLNPDGSGHPMVIDFGVAKATNQKLTEKTLFTNFATMIGTPAYMSPEQAEMSKLDVDTRSDIYSLGVLLYELLTGTTPFPEQRLRSVAYGEMQRIIVEEEPERPSTRLRKTVLTESVASLATRHPSLATDLDWIVMKCLEKDRARRYETANGLASDVQRHMNHEPVVACPPSAVYRFQKLVRRNKLAFASGVGIAAALVIGLAIALWQTIEKTRAYNRAVVAEQAAQTEAAILKDMLEGAGPEVAKGRDATILLEILEKTAARIGQELTNQPAVESDLSVTVGRLYGTLGQYQKAEIFLRRALAISDQLNPDGDYSQILSSLAEALLDVGKLAEAEQLQGKALAMHRKFSGDDAVTAVLLGKQAEYVRGLGKLSEAKLIAEEALILGRKFLGDDDSRTALILTTLAGVEQNQRNYADAETHLRKGAAILEKKADQAHDLQIVRMNLALALEKQNKSLDAEIIMGEALSAQQKLLGEDHPVVAQMLNGLGVNLAEQGKLLEAEKRFHEALAIQRKRLVKDDPTIGLTLNSLGGTLYRQGKLIEAEPFLREVVDLYRRNADWSIDFQSSAFDFLGKVLAEQGNLSEAEAVQFEHLSMLHKRAPDNDRIAAATAELAVTLIAEKKFTDAEPIARECLEFREKRWPDRWGAFSARLLVGESLLGQKKCTDAEPLLLAGYEGTEQRKNEHGSNAWRYARQPGARKALQLLVQLYEETNRPDRAAEWKTKLAALNRESMDAQLESKKSSPQ